MNAEGTAMHLDVCTAALDLNFLTYDDGRKKQSAKSIERTDVQRNR